MLTIQKADEIADFAGFLGDIDNIFSNPASDVIFAVKKKSNRFERCRSAGTLKNIAAAFLSILMTTGVSSGILLAA